MLLRSLPIEIRRLIYNDVFEANYPVLRRCQEIEDINDALEVDPDIKFADTSLLLVNKATHDDIAPFFYQYHTIHHSINDVYDQAYKPDSETGRPPLKNINRTRDFTNQPMLRFLTQLSLDYSTMWLHRGDENREKKKQKTDLHLAIYENIDTEIATILHALCDKAPALQTLSLSIMLFRGVLPRHRPIPLGGETTRALGKLIPRLKELNYTAVLDVKTKSAVMRRLVPGHKWSAECLSVGATPSRNGRFADLWEREAILAEHRQRASEDSKRLMARLHPHIDEELKYLVTKGCLHIQTADGEQLGQEEDDNEKEQEGNEDDASSLHLWRLSSSNKQCTNVDQRRDTRLDDNVRDNSASPKFWDNTRIRHHARQPSAYWEGMQMWCGTPKLREHSLADVRESCLIEGRKGRKKRMSKAA